MNRSAAEFWGSDDQPDIAVGFLDGSLEHTALSAPESGGDGPPAQVEAKEEAKEMAAGSRIESAKDSGSGLHACATGDISLLSALLAHGWDAGSVIDRQRSNGLHWAAGGGHTEVCKLLLRARNGGADCTSHGRRALDVNAPNGSSRTPLHWAARNGHAATCAWLAAGGDDGGGADVELTSKDGVNVFHWAVWSGSLETCRWALRSVRRDLVLAVNRWGCDATHWAAATGNVQLCAWVAADAGLDFEKRNNQGHDGLMKAAWNGHAALCAFLLGLPDLHAHPPPESQEQVATDSPARVIVRDAARALRLLRREDRAGLTAAQLAHIKGHTSLRDALRRTEVSLAAECQVAGRADASGGASQQDRVVGGGERVAPEAAVLADDDAGLGVDAAKIGVEFELYYRRVVGGSAWGRFARAMLSALPRTVWQWSWRRAAAGAAAGRGEGAALSVVCAQITQRDWRGDGDLRAQVKAAGRLGSCAAPSAEVSVEEMLPLLLLDIRWQEAPMVWHMCADRAVPTAAACLAMLVARPAAAAADGPSAAGGGGGIGGGDAPLLRAGSCGLGEGGLAMGDAFGRGIVQAACARAPTGVLVANGLEPKVRRPSSSSFTPYRSMRVLPSVSRSAIRSPSCSPVPRTLARVASAA